MKRLFIYFILCAFSIGVHADDGVMYVYLSDGSFRGFYNDEIDSISYSHYDLDSIWHEEMVTQDIWRRDTVERLSLCMIDSISYSLPETTYKDNVIILDERYQPYILAHDSLTITFSPNLPDYLHPSVGNVLLYEDSNELFPYGFSGTITQINGDVVLCDSASLEDVYERLYFFGTYTLVENDQGSNANGYSLCRITRSSNSNRWLWGDDDDDDSDWGIFEGSVDDIPFDTYKIAEKIEFTSKNIFAAVSGSVTPTASIEFAFIANVYEPLIFYKETDRFDYDAKLQIGFNKDFTPKHPKDFDKPFSVHKVGQEAETEKGLNLYFFNISVPVPQCPVLTIGYKAGLFIDPNLEAEAVLGVDFSMTKEKTHIFSLDKTNIWKNGDWSHYEKKPTVTCEPEVEGSLTGSVWAGLMAAINVGVGSDKNGIKGELSAKIGPYIEFELNLDLIDFNSDMSFYSGLKDSKMKRGIKGAISLDFTAKMAKVFNYKWTLMQISPEKLWFEKVDYLFPTFEAPEYYTNGNTLNCSMNLTRCTFANHVGMRIVDESGNEETKWMEDTFKDWTEETPFNFGLSFDNLDFKNHRYTIIPVTRLWFFPTLKVPDPMRTYVTCPDSHHPHLIDLGLPSGVKWLCSNVYADKPTDAGGYYQWGNAYKQVSYDESYTFPDIGGSNFQGSSHDAATANLGEEYVTPTAKQFEELLSHCYKTIKYSNWAQKEGLFLKAPNGADLYLPFSGYMNGQDIESKTKGYYIVSDNNMGDGTTNNPILELNGDESSYSSAKWYGYSVRPISIPSSTYLILSTSHVNIKVGESMTVDVTSGSGSYDAVSNAKDVATVTVEGSKIIVNAVSPGSATITVKDNQTQEWAKIEVTVSDGQSTITVTPQKLDFGELDVDDYGSRYLTFVNSGDEEIDVTVETQDPYSAHPQFSHGRPGHPYNFSITANSQKLIRIEFRPRTAGVYNSEVIVTSNGIAGGKLSIPVYGKGIEVPDDPSFHLSANSLDVYVRDEKFVKILNGSGDYEIINDYPDIVEADINGSHWAHIPPMLGPLKDGGGSIGDIWWITGKKVGQAILKLKDKETNEELTLNVEVKHAPLLSLSAQSIEVDVGETDSSIEIKTGSDWYDISSDNPEIATASKTYKSVSWVDESGVAHGGTFVEIQGLKAGNTKVKVKDMSSGIIVEVDVTVKEGPYAVYNDGVLTFYYDGELSNREGLTYSLSNDNPGWLNDWDWDVISVEKVVFTPSFAKARPKSTAKWFCMYSINTIEGIENLNTSQVKNMNGMFSSCRSLKSIDLSHFETSNVLSMEEMFFDCQSLISLDLSHFDTSNVTDMGKMFDQCYNLESLELGNLNTSKVTNMYRMFALCGSLKNLDVSHLNTSSVKNMKLMFWGLSLKNLDVSHFDTSNVTDMSGMFANTSVSNLDLSHFNTSKVKNMQQMFSSCTSLTSLDVSHFNTSKVEDVQQMFSSCTSLTSLDLSHFDTSNVTNMNSLFKECTSLKSLNVSHFDTSNVTDMELMFSGCSSLTSLDVSHFNTSNVTSFLSMFFECSSLASIDVSHFDTSNATSLYAMFYNCSSLSSLDISHFDTSNVTNMEMMFGWCSSLKTIYCGNLWNMNNVLNSNNMFGGCFSLVGGKGTVFDSDHTDGEYARIDGGSARPGYFTASSSSPAGSPIHDVVLSNNH